MPVQADSEHPVVCCEPVFENTGLCASLPGYYWKLLHRVTGCSRLVGGTRMIMNSRSRAWLKLDSHKCGFG